MVNKQPPSIVDENDVVVNATGLVITGFKWPNLALHFYVYVSVIVSHALFITITVVISRKCLFLKLARTANHAFYCALGQVLCVSEAIMIHDAMLHPSFGLMACALGFYGVVAQLMIKKKHHFNSKHGRFGLFACFLLLASLISGMWLLFQQLRKEFSNNLMLAHRVCGMFCFMITMTTLMFSYNTGFMHRNWTEHRITLFKCCTMLATILAVCNEFRHFVIGFAAVIPKHLLDTITLYDRKKKLEKESESTYI